MPPPDTGSDAQSLPGPTRRQTLSALGSVGTVTALAGCGRVTEYEFAAPPVVLADARRRALGYVETLSETVVETRNRTVAGADVEVTVESEVRGYRAVEGTLRTTAAGPDLGVVSTPPATVEGESFNPVAERPVGDLLTSDAGRAFLERVGLAEVGHERERIRWERGPTVVGGSTSSCLGTETAVRTHAGVLAGEPPSVAFVHGARVEADSVVLATGIHGEDVADPSLPYVDGEESYASADGLRRAREILEATCGSLEYGGGDA